MTHPVEQLVDYVDGTLPRASVPSCSRAPADVCSMSG